MVQPSLCDEDQLRRLLEEELSKDECLQVETHVEQCSACQRHLELLAADEQWWNGLPRFLSPQSPLDILGDQPDGDQKLLRECDDATRYRIRDYFEPTDTPGSLGRFGPYEITEIIGTGAMGVVLRGIESKLNRHVAIKVLAPHYASSGAARRRFQREARSAAAVVHQHVVPIHAVGSENDLPDLVMAYVP
ncbi:MAG: protein kinase, partial [Planctomycetes bacterium]|nr:protein kinase [Planctomycetota bacterium]